MKLDRPICKTALYRTGKRWYNLFSFSGKEMLMEQQQKTRKHAAFAVIRIVLILLLFGIVAFSAYRIYAIVHEYAIGQDTYRSVADAFLITPSPVPKNAAVPIPTPVPSDSELPSASPDPDDDRIAGTAPIAVDFERLLQENGDCVGWIYCEDTKINYPVMQSDDNAAYLHRLFDGSYNSSGSLFMDFRNDPNLTDLNTVIFGHSMKDHSMFATLRDFRNQTFYASHPHLYFLTPHGDFRLDPIACAVVSAFSDSYEFYDTEEDLHAYLERIAAISLIQTDTDLASVRRIMTLSTCSLEERETRIILVCAVRTLSGN